MGLIILVGFVLIMAYIQKMIRQSKINAEITRNGGMSKMFGSIVQSLSQWHPKALVRHKTNSVSFALRDTDDMIHNYKIIIKTDVQQLKWQYINPYSKDCLHLKVWDLGKLSTILNSNNDLIAGYIITEVQKITNRGYNINENQTGVVPLMMVV